MSRGRRPKTGKIWQRLVHLACSELRFDSSSRPGLWNSVKHNDGHETVVSASRTVICAGLAPSAFRTNAQLDQFDASGQRSKLSLTNLHPSSISPCRPSTPCDLPSAGFDLVESQLASSVSSP